MRTTVTLDEDVYSAAAQMAQASGQRLGKVLSDLARRGLNPPLPEVQREGGRWPSFHIPPGTPPIDSQKLEDLWDEENLF